MDLIKINYNTEQPTVSARDLYDLLSDDGGTAGTERFSKWFDRYTGYGFQQGMDFSTPIKKVRVQFEGKREVSRVVDDYNLSVDMAKQICMLQRTDKGKELRQYFIDLERAWNTPEQVFARALKMADATIKSLQIKNEVLDKQNELLTAKTLTWDGRPFINACVRQFAGHACDGSFGMAWVEFKKELLYKYGININSRITNYLNSTGKKTKPKTLNMLDDSEVSDAVSTIISMCREKDVDISDLVRNLNHNSKGIIL